MNNKVVFLIAIIIMIYGGYLALTDSNKVVYRVPLLEQCEEDVVRTLTKLSSESDFLYEVIKFDRQITAQPFFSGFVVLSSDSLDIASLERRANAFVIACYPQNTTKIIKSGMYGTKVQNLLHLNKRLGIEVNYITDHGEYLEVTYKLPSGIQKQGD